MPATTYMQYNSNAYPILGGRTFFVGTNSDPKGIIASDQGGGVPGTNTYGVEWYKPFASLQYAITQCVDSRGDRIVVMPGHTETVTAAGGVNFSKAGISVIGLGNGTDRPQLLCSTAATASYIVSAANVKLENLYFDATGVASVDLFLDVNASNFIVKDSYFLVGDATNVADVALDIGTSTDSLVDNCTFYNAEANAPAASSTVIRVSGVASGLQIRNSHLDAPTAADTEGLVDVVGAALGVLVKDCTFHNSFGGAKHTIDLNDTITEGMIVNCHHMIGSITTAGADVKPILSTTPNGFWAIVENYVVNDQGAATHGGEAGALVGTASAA